jgi:hypothetical protein
MCRRLECGVPKERVDGGQSQIPAANAHTFLFFQAVEKGDDQRRIDVLEHQTRWRLMKTHLDELQELTERVSIRTDRVGARSSLLYQPLSEKTL